MTFNGYQSKGRYIWTKTICHLAIKAMSNLDIKFSLNYTCHEKAKTFFEKLN